MDADDFRRIALSLEGAEASSHMGQPDFRVGGTIFATLASAYHGYGNLMLTPEQQAAFVEELPEVFVPIERGGGTHGNDSNSAGSGKQGRSGRCLAHSMEAKAREKRKIRQEESGTCKAVRPTRRSVARNAEGLPFSIPCESFFNEDGVIAHRSGNAQAHVRVLSNNAVKVVLTGEVFRRLFIEVVCDAKVAQSQASQPGAEGSKAAGQPVRMVVWTDHAKYGLRDSMKLSASLQNTTDEPVYVDRRMFWTGYGGGLKLEIRNERGEPLPARVLSDAIMPPPVEGDTSILIRLDEGFFYGTWVNLSVKDFFSKPGRYSIRVIYKSWLRREFVAPQQRDLPAIWADTSDIPSDQVWVDVVQ